MRRPLRVLGIDAAWTAQEIPNIRNFLPPRLRAFPSSRRKGVEDTLDALICAWAGVEFLRGRAEPFGDADAAIWIPLARKRSTMRE